MSVDSDNSNKKIFKNFELREIVTNYLADILKILAIF